MCHACAHKDVLVQCCANFFLICCYAQFSKNIKLAIDDVIFVDNLASVGKKVMVQVNSLQIIIVAALLCEYRKSGIFVVKIFL